MIVLGVSLAGTRLGLLAQRGEQHGRPAFTTLPIPDGVEAVVLRNGRVIYVPAVAAPNIKAPGGRPPGGGGGGGRDFGQSAAVQMVANCFANSTNNFDATCATDSYQGEPMLAADGTAGRLIGAENDIYPGQCKAKAQPGAFGDCGLSATVSTNGQAWTRFKLTRNWGGHNYLIAYDPSVAVDSQGRYLVAYGVSDGGSNSANGLVVVSSNDGGASWTKTNPVALNSSGGNFEDKMWIAADANSGSAFKDRLYVAWDRNTTSSFGITNQILMVSSSSDQDKTWSTPKKINDGTSVAERVIYAFPALALNGTVHVLWHDYAQNRIFIDKSTDGEANWGTDVAVASVNIGFVDIGCNGGRSMAPAPQMAIAPNPSSSAGYDIYVVFANNVTSGSSVNLDVYLTKSTDGGASWSASVRVSSTSAGHQYNPAISADSLGTINVSYLDRRDDANNCRTHTYLSRSTDGGSNFTDTRVTDADSSFDGNPNGPGDYSGIASLGNKTYPCFSDHRAANVSLQTGTAGAFEIYSAVQP